MRDKSAPAFVSDPGWRHAVVVGAGISGLLAGRVLATYFDRVTILDRDTLPHDPVSRKGVPQDRHLHSLATRGGEIFKELGLTGRLLHRISREVLALAVEREDVARTLLEVKNLLEPPSTLLRPGILLPALGRTALSLLTKHKRSRTSERKAGWATIPSELADSGEGAFLVLELLIGT